jgi:uncharacterized protein
MVSFRQTGSLVLLFFLFTTGVSSQKYKKDSLPQPLGYVNDFENIFSKKQEKYLDSVIVAYERKTTIEIALITIDTSMVSKSDLENYVLKIARKWGVGKKEKNNGIVIGLSKGYRYIRIHNGYSIEAMLSDIETKQIIDTAFIPSFKKEQYFEGVVNGLKAIMKKLD